MKPTRAMSPPGTYFVTFTTWQRRRLFVVEPYARLFLKTLYGYKKQGRFQLHEFVVMPEHVHLMLTPAVDITLERAMQFIKGGYSHLWVSTSIGTGRFGKEDSRITAFVTRRILKGTGIIFIRTR